MKSIRHIDVRVYFVWYIHTALWNIRNKASRNLHRQRLITALRMYHIHQVTPYIVGYRTEIRKMYIVLHDFSFLHTKRFPRFIYRVAACIYDRPPVLTGNVIWKKLVATSPFPIQDLFPIRNPDDLVSMDFTCKSVRLVLCYKYYGLYEAGGGGRWPRLHGRLAVRKVAVYHARNDDDNDFWMRYCRLMGLGYI